MATSVLQVIIKTIKEGTGDKEAAHQAKELKSALNDLGLGALGSVTALGAATGAVMALTAFAKDSIDTTVKYAGEIKNLSLITGELPEETSRVVQVMDDFKLTTDDLTKAQKKLSDNGLSLNIENLGKLSEQYRQLNTGAEKTQFLLDNFGKTGLQFADAMEQGEAKLRGMSDAVDDSLIMTQDGIRQAEEYRLAMDELSDAWMGFKITVGQKVIPELTRILTDYNAQHEDWFTRQQPEHLKGAVGANADAIRRMREQMASLDKPLDSAGNSYQAMAKVMANSAKNGVQIGTEALEAQAAAAKEASKQNKDLLGSAAAYTKDYQTQAESIQEVNAERAELEKALAEEQAKGWAASAEKIQEYNAKLGELPAKEQAAAAAAELASKTRLLGMLEQQFAIDGLNEKETNYLLSLGEKWGVYSASAVQAARDAIAEVAILKADFDNLPTERTMMINVIASSGYQTGQQYANMYDASRTRDSGGRGTPGEAYVIGTGAQPEVFIPDAAGSFYPSGAYTMAGAGGGGQAVDVTIRLAGDADKMFAPVIERGVRRMR